MNEGVDYRAPRLQVDARAFVEQLRVREELEIAGERLLLHLHVLHVFEVARDVRQVGGGAEDCVPLPYAMRVLKSESICLENHDNKVFPA